MMDFVTMVRHHPYSLAAQAMYTGWRDNPDLLRRTLRDSTPGQILICALLSIPVGALIVALHYAILVAHALTFDIDIGEHLSAATDISPRRLLLVPILGGLCLGAITWGMQCWYKRDIVDPIEANAVHGGRMSIFGSVRLIGASFLSNAFGASVGMEAAYTQLGAAIHSAAGKLLHLRRDDMRIFVAAGAAAAIAAAFNAPLAGAFYGFELILGAYTVSAISHVAAAALVGALTAQIFTHGEPIFALPLAQVSMPDWYYLLFVLQGIAGAFIGILTMMIVTRCEQLTRKLHVPEWLRPAMGGLLLGVLAMSAPQILGSGQGAINEHLHQAWPLLAVAGLLLAKIAGSALSIGLGFRGGLFSSSLLIGCLFGQIFGIGIGHFLPQGQENLDIFMLVGMGAVGASIVGAPVTMVLLILEMTGSFPAATSVLMGVLAASAITRHYFGYSFSTWRFHLRGLRINGAHDVGWIQDITVASLMRKDFLCTATTTPREELPALIPKGSGKRLYVVDDAQRFAGRIDANGITANHPGATAGELAHAPEHYLHEQQNIQEALQRFTAWEAEILPVLDSEQRLVGTLSETYALRRYTQELETRNMAQLGIATTGK